MSASNRAPAAAISAAGSSSMGSIQHTHMAITAHGSSHLSPISAELPVSASNRAPAAAAGGNSSIWSTPLSSTSGRGCCAGGSVACSAWIASAGAAWASACSTWRRESVMKICSVRYMSQRGAAILQAAAQQPTVCFSKAAAYFRSARCCTTTVADHEVWPSVWGFWLGLGKSSSEEFNACAPCKVGAQQRAAASARQPRAAALPGASLTMALQAADQQAFGLLY